MADLSADDFIRAILTSARRVSEIEFASALMMAIEPPPKPISNCGRPLWTAADLASHV